MLRMVDIEYIRKKHFLEGWSIRKISRNLVISRQSVRKTLQSSEIPKYALSKAKSCPVMDPYKEIVQEWLQQDRNVHHKQHHTARRIYQRLQDEYDFQGSESTVRRYVQILKQQTAEVFIPLTADWGEQAQVDWGRAKVYLHGRLTEVSLFCLRMKASLVPFVWASPTEKLEGFLEGHRRAFEWLGGVPANLVYDNPKTAVTKILKGPYREEHSHFSSLRAHYLFDSEFCNPASGNEKGTVENLVKFVRRNAMVPVPRINSLEELNRTILNWCEKERLKRWSDWEQECQELRQLPSWPFSCSRTHMVTASNLLLFQFDRNHYSVPAQYNRRHLRIEAFADRVEVYDAAQLLTTHARSYNRGEKIMQLEHYLPILATKPRAAKNALVDRKLPEVYQKLRRCLCSRHPEGYREFAAILLLNRDHPCETVLQAVENALQCGSPSLNSVLLSLHSASRADPLVSVKPILEIPVDDPAKFNRLLEGAIA